MNVKYDRANDLFWVGKKQVYWSSIYVLRQKKTEYKKLLKKLKVSKDEEKMFKKELDDLRKLGFIKGKNKISTTAKGREFLREVEHRMQFKHLRDKSIEDIDDVFDEAKKIYRLDFNKTKLLVKRMPLHKERVDWFPLFVNSTIGYFAFIFIILVIWLGLGGIDFDEFIIQAVLSPVASVMTVGIATIVIYLLYHAGQGFSSYAFRKRK